MWSCPACKRRYNLNPSEHGRLVCVCGVVTTGDTTNSPVVVPPPGPGTELANLFLSIGITEQTGCRCKAIAAAMDRAGVAGCREHRSEFLAALGESARKFSWWDKLKAVPKLVREDLPLSLAGLFDEAVRRAEEKSTKPLTPT